MKNPTRKYDDTTLIIAGGVAAALLGAGAATGWAWLRREPFETKMEHRRRAGRITSLSFGLAGALGAAAATALLGPKAAGEKDWRHLLDHMSDSVGDLRKRVEKISHEVPRLR